MAWPFDNDVAGALGQAPKPVAGGALPILAPQKQAPRVVKLPNLAPGILPDPEPVTFGALPPPAPPPAPTPRSTGQKLYDNLYNIVAGAPTEAYHGALSGLKEAMTAQPESYRIGPGLNNLAQLGDIAMQVVNLPFAPVAAGARELGRQLIPGANPAAFDADPNAKPDLLNPDALASALGFLGENAVYAAPIPGARGVGAAKAAKAERIRALDTLDREGLAKRAEPVEPVRLAPEPIPQPVAPAVAPAVKVEAPAAPAPAPATPVQPRWDAMYDEADNHVGWYDRRSGTVRKLEEGPPETAAPESVTPPASPLPEATAQPSPPPPAEAAPPAPVKPIPEQPAAPNPPAVTAVSQPVTPEIAAEALKTNIDPATGARPKGNAALREFRARMQTAAQEVPAIQTAPAAPAPTFRTTPGAIAAEHAAEVSALEAAGARDAANNLAPKQGRVRGVQVTPSQAPSDAATFLARKGGINNTEGHDLVKGRGLQQFVPRAGPLIRPTGMSIDEAGLHLWEEGYFGPPDRTPRPTENDVLQLLEKTAGKNKVYPPEVGVAVNEAKQAALTEEANAAAHQEVRDAAKGLGVDLTDEHVPEVAALMGGKNLDAESAIVEYTERLAQRHEDALAKETGDEAYRSIPFEGNAEPSGTAGTGLERPARQPEDAGGLRPSGSNAAKSDSAAPEISARQLAAEREARRAVPSRPELAAEPGAEGLPQTIIPGAERASEADLKSAADRKRIEESRQLPRANSGKVQKPNDQGLFAPPPEKTLFQRGTKQDKRELIIQHSTTAQKLMHADRMGGLAAPSLAVTKAKEPITSFGDITMIGPKEMADPKSGTKVFGVDVYSPRYPEIGYKLDNAAIKKLDGILGPYWKPGEKHYYDTALSRSDDLRNNKAFQKYAEENFKDARGYADYKAASEEVLRKIGAEERIFKGFTNSGNRRYEPHTLDNVLRILKKDLRGGESFNYGVGSLRAKYTPEFKSVASIKKESGRLLPKEKFETVKKEIDDEFWKLASELQPYSNRGKEFGFGDTVISAFEDAKKLGLKRALEEYQIDGVPDDVLRHGAEFLEKLRNLPTEYFEAKILRGVGVSEFRHAVIPDRTPQAVKDMLAKRGVRVTEYPAGNESARKIAVEKVSGEHADDVMFQRGNGAAPESTGERVKLGDGLVGRMPEAPTPAESALIDEVGKIAQKIVPTAKVRVARELRADLGGAEQSAGDTVYGATYRNGPKRLIAWSLETPDAPGTLRHEAVHYLKRSEFIAPKEWEALAAEAEKKGWLEKHNIPTRYSDLDRATQIEESVAEEYAAWARGQSKATPAARRVFAKIKNLLGQVAGHVRKVFGKDATAQDIFRKIESGEVGKRGVQAKEEAGASLFAQRPAMRDPQIQDGPFNRLATDPPQSMREEMLDDTRSLVSRLKSATSKVAINESIDRTRTALQDRFLPLLRTQSAVEKQLGRKLAENENPYLSEELSTGRKGAKLEDLTENMVRPLFTAMHENGVTPEELESYLYARHAPERNAQIQKINPKFGQAKPTLFEEAKTGAGGSGMLDEEAAAIMQAVEESGKKPALEALAKRVDDIIALGMKERVEAGLMSKDDAARWRDTYKSYVPLRGFAELEGMGLGDEARPRTGGSFNIRGAESQRAFGRETKAADILAHAIMGAEEAIVRGESNRVGQAFYNLAEKMPNTDFWSIDKIETKPVWMESSQSVEYRPTKQLSALDKDYTISLKIDGDEHRITLNRNNPAARRLAESMKNLKGDQVSLLANTFGRVNRYLSHVNTTLNPEFVISNAFRDVQEAMVNLQQFDLKGITKGTIRDWPKALKAATQGAFHKGEGEWAKWYKEFREDGARTYFNQVDDLRAQRLKLQREFKLAKPGLHPVSMPGTSARKIIRSVFGYIEGVNLGVENGIRLSAYKNARETGLSRAEAASLAKNLTINFNRRGTYGPLINSMYLFYNASMQGTAIMMGALKSPRVRKIVGAAVATGGMLEMLNSMTSGKDKDGELFYDKIDDYTKSHNLVIMDPTSDEGRYIKLPLPYGYGSFFAIGRSAAEIGRGKPATHVASTLFGAIADAFNPIGGSGDSVLKLLSPTLTDPVVELSQNRDFTGKPIVPEQNELGPQKPQSQMYWNSVSPGWKHIAATLNAATGGDEVKPGAIDISPEVLDYMWGQATGAAGSFYQRNADLGAKIFDPETDVTWGDIPMARRLIGSRPTWYDKQMFFERSKNIEQELAYVKDYARRGDIGKAKGEIADYRDLLSLSGVANQTKMSLSGIRQARNALIFQHDLGKVSDEAYKTRIKQLKESEKAVITQFNTLYVKTAKPAYVPQTPAAKPQPTPAAPAQKKAALVPAFKSRDFASLSGTWAPQDAASAAQSTGMPATARILRGMSDSDTLLRNAA